MVPPAHYSAYHEPGPLNSAPFRHRDRPPPPHPGFPGYAIPEPLGVSGYARHSSVQPHSTPLRHPLAHAAGTLNPGGSLRTPHFKHAAYYGPPANVAFPSGLPPRYRGDPRRDSPHFQASPAPLAYFERRYVGLSSTAASPYGQGGPPLPTPPPLRPPYPRALTVQPPDQRAGPSKRALDFLLRASDKASDATHATLQPTKEEPDAALVANTQSADELAKSIPRQISLDLQQPTDGLSGIYAEPKDEDAEVNDVPEAASNLALHKAPQGVDASKRNGNGSEDKEEDVDEAMPTHSAVQEPSDASASETTAPYPRLPNLAAPASAPVAVPVPALAPAKEPVRLQGWCIRLACVPNLPPRLVDDIVQETDIERDQLASLHRWIQISGTRRYSDEARKPGTESQPDAIWRTNMIAALADPSRAGDGSWRVSTYSGTIYELVGPQRSQSSEDHFLAVRRKVLEVRGAAAAVESVDVALELWREVLAHPFGDGWRARVARACLALEAEIDRRAPSLPRLELARRKRARVVFALDANDFGEGAALEIGADEGNAGDLARFAQSDKDLLPQSKKRRRIAEASTAGEGDAGAEIAVMDDGPCVADEGYDTDSFDTSRLEASTEARTSEASARESRKGEAARGAAPARTGKEDNVEYSFSRPRSSLGLEVVVEIPQRSSKNTPGEPGRRRMSSSARRSDIIIDGSARIHTRSAKTASNISRVASSATPSRDAPSAVVGPAAPIRTARSESASAHTPIRVKSEVEQQLSGGSTKKISRELMALMSGPFGTNPAARRGFLEGCSADNPILLDQEDAGDVASIRSGRTSDSEEPLWMAVARRAGRGGGEGGAVQSPSTRAGAAPVVRPGSESCAGDASFGDLPGSLRPPRSGKRLAGRGVAKFWIQNPITSPQVIYKREQSDQRRRSKILQAASKRTEPGDLGAAAADVTSGGKGVLFSTGVAAITAAVEGSDIGDAAAAARDGKDGNDDGDDGTGSKGKATTTASATDTIAGPEKANSVPRPDRQAANGTASYSVRKLVREQLQKAPQLFTAATKLKAKIPPKQTITTSGRSASGRRSGTSVVAAAGPAQAGPFRGRGLAAPVPGRQKVPKTTVRSATIAAAGSTSQAPRRKTAKASKDAASGLVEDDDEEWEDALAEQDTDGASKTAAAAVDKDDDDDDDDAESGFFLRFQTITGDSRPDTSAPLGFGVVGDDYYFSD